MDAVAGGGAGQPHRQVERAKAKQGNGQQGDREGHGLPDGGMSSAYERGTPGGFHARSQPRMTKPTAGVLQEAGVVVGQAREEG